MSVGLGTAIGYLTLNISGFANGIDSAISDMDRLNGSYNSTTKKLQTAGETFSKVGTFISAGLTAPVVGAISASTKFGAEFDKQMSAVSAVTNATSEDFEAMRESAISWGAKTVYTATEAAEALYYMGLAGWDSEDAIAGLGPVLNLAAAGNLSLGSTSDIVTDALTAFGLTAKDTTHFTNILATTMSNSNTDVDMLGESFKYVAPVAGAFGYAAEDVALALGIFANNGVKASQAGTGLRQALNSVINPSDKAAILMDEYGVSLFNADGSTKELITVLEELRGTFGNVSANAEEISNYIEELGVDLSTAEGEAIATDAIMEKFGHNLPITEMENLSAIVKIFGVRALPGMLSVINASDEDFYGLYENINNADEAFVRFGDEIYTMDEAIEQFGERVYNDDSFEILGSAAGIAEKQMDNLAGTWQIFLSALGAAKIKINDVVKDSLQNLLEKLTELVNKFNNLDEEQVEQIVKWAKVAAAIGPAILVVGKVISGINGLITIFGTLGKVFTTIKTSITTFTTALKMITTGLTAPVQALSKLKIIFTALSGSVLAVVAVIVVLVAAFADLWKNNEEFRNRIIEVWEKIKAVFVEAGEKIVEIFNSLGFTFEDFQELMSAAIDVLKAIWQGFCDFLAPIFVGVFSIIGDVLSGIVEVFTGIIEVIVGIVKGFKDGDWSMLWEGIGDIVVAVVDTILGVLDHLGEMIYNVIKTVAGWFGSDWTMTWDEAKQAVADWFNSVVEWFAALPGKIMEFLLAVGEAIQNFFSILTQFLGTIVSTISKFFTDILISVAEWVTKMIKGAVELGKNFVETIVSFFTELPGEIAKFLTTALDNVTKWVTDMVSQARDMAKDFLNNIIEFFTELPGKIGNFIQAALDTVVQWAADMVSKAKEMAEGFLNNIVSFFSQLPGKIKDFITTAFNNVKQWATDMVNKAKEMAQTFLNNIVEFFSQLPGKILNFITSAWNSVTAWASNMANKAKEMAQSFLNNIISFFTKLPGEIKNKLDESLTKVASWGSDLVQKGKDAIKMLIDGVIDAAKNIGEKVADIGKNIVEGVWSGIKKAKDSFFTSVKNFFSGIVDGVKDLLGIESPSKVFRDQVGVWIPPGISEGFAKAMPAAIDDMEESLNKGIDKIESEDIDINNVSFETQIEEFANMYKQVFEDLVIWFETIEDRLALAVKGLTEYLKYLVNIRQAISNGEEFKSLVVIKEKEEKPNKPIEPDTPSGTPSGGGDTFNFYSPKAINEVQAARLLKNTKRDLAEGF